MNLYSLHVHVAVQRGPLLSAPFVGIGILHFSVLKRKNDDAKWEQNIESQNTKNMQIQILNITKYKYPSAFNFGISSFFRRF